MHAIMTQIIHLCHWGLIAALLVISIVQLYGLGKALQRKDTGYAKAQLLKLTAVAIAWWLIL